jgi:hypothetical protein
MLTLTIAYLPNSRSQGPVYQTTSSSAGSASEERALLERLLRPESPDPVRAGIFSPADAYELFD